MPAASLRASGEFQSTLPRGSDQELRIPMQVVTHFNPRSLAGATRKMWRGCRSCVFQSTLPRGSDRRLAGCCLALDISIHAPSRERRHLNLHDHPQRQISIHAPSRERRAATFLIRTVAPISIHAPSRERRMGAMWGCHIAFHFNPRSLAGATNCARHNRGCCGISIHAPSRERL